MVFCFQNCFDLVKIKNSYWNSRLKISQIQYIKMKNHYNRETCRKRKKNTWLIIQSYFPKCSDLLLTSMYRTVAYVTFSYDCAYVYCVFSSIAVCGALWKLGNAKAQIPLQIHFDFLSISTWNSFQNTVPLTVAHIAFLMISLTRLLTSWVDGTKVMQDALAANFFLLTLDPVVMWRN